MSAQLLLAADLAGAAEWPGPEAWLRVLTLRDYNTRVVIIGVSALGLAAGIVGSFMLLRKRALLGDALSHATLPGIGLAFLLLVALGGTGKSLPALLAGATLTGLLGMAAILALTRYTRLKQDAALGIVLSVFFGAGAAVLGVIQNLRSGHAAGLETFIYGKTASMVAGDAWAIVVAALLTCAASLLLFKELTLLCFDAAYGVTQGRPILLLDSLLMALVIAVTVIGLQAVGLILMVALLVIPPAAARFWTERLARMIWIAGALGALSGALGAAGSALFARLPAGALIVLVAGAGFVVSMLFGAARGALPRWLERLRLTRRVHDQHLLRALYELGEIAAATSPGDPAIRPADLLARRSWSAHQVNALLRRAQRRALVEPTGEGWRLTAAGQHAAWRATRNHRLWELFLIHHADIAPSHVDRGADQVEHVLGPQLIDELELLLVDRHPGLARPASPHALPGAAHGGG